MCSFMRDERGATEPYTDMPALGIVAVGLIVFAYILLSAYASYASEARYADARGSLKNAAHAIAADPALTIVPYTFDAIKLDRMQQASAGYGAITIAVEAPGYRWARGNASGGTKASCSLPVSVRLSDARCIAGSLTVSSGDW